MTMKLGNLSFTPAKETPALVAKPVHDYLDRIDSSSIWVSEIDASLADTAAFCEHYQIGMDVSANCVVLKAKREGKTWYAACLVLATSRADVNGVVRKELGASKISFAPMDEATSLSQMEYGGITPIGLPEDWPILIDSNVMSHDKVVIGSGIRGSKIYAATDVLAALPNVKVMDIANVQQ
jgi:prolyl-tRNA editing enzyme YbaK/EbsC (Cys-tRNA(Pro) deacylase)